MCNARTDAVLSVMKSHHNICKQIHLPAQSGSSSVLQRMRRGYTREAYDALAAHIRSSVPGIAISSDFIAGFCGETEAEHRDTVDLLDKMQYEMAFLFAYSMRERTHAHRNYKCVFLAFGSLSIDHLRRFCFCFCFLCRDDVPEDVKQRRLSELIESFRRGGKERNKRDIGSRQLVLVEVYVPLAAALLRVLLSVQLG